MSFSVDVVRAEALVLRAEADARCPCSQMFSIFMILTVFGNVSTTFTPVPTIPASSVIPSLSRTLSFLSAFE